MHKVLTLGGAQITRIEDNPGPALEAKVMFPAFRDEVWEADRDILVLPTHFAEPHGCRVVSGGRGYAIRWI